LSKVNIKNKSTFLGHKEAIYALGQLSKDSFLSAGSDKMLIKWSYKNKNKGSLVAKIPETVFTLQLNRSKDQCLCGTQNGNLLILDLNKNTLIKHLQLNAGAVFDIKHYDEYNYILACGSGELIIINKTDFTIKSRISISNSNLRCINIFEKRIALGCSDKSIYIINYQQHKLEKCLSGHDSSVFCLSTNHKGQLISGSRDAHLNLWSHENMLLEQRVPAHNFTINSLALNPNPSFNLIATASRDKSIKIWDTNTLKLFKVVNAQKQYSHQRSVNNLLWLDDNYLISASDDKSLILWQIEIT
jgi:WD40 repeat protein